MRRPRLKLITIPWELEVPTLGLASLAAVTPPDFDIAIVDLLRERLHLDEEVDLVGITASTPRITAAYALADLYRARGATVVLGGHHATAMPREALEHADAVVCGEGEVSWRRLCDDFLVAKSRVHGVYRDPPPDLGTLPQPRLDLMHLERYGRFYFPLIASRGCPEVCTFCFAKRMTVGYRTYPIAHVLEQVRRRPKSMLSCYFVDDNLPADPDYSRELFAALAKTDVRFGMQARNEFSQDVTNLEQARAAGCVLISSGYESVNQSTLEGTSKRADVRDYREVIANIFRVGMLPSGNWMFGFDWDTPDIFQRTLDFLDSTDMMHCSFTTEIPFPGTSAFRKYEREGRLLTVNYDDYVGKDGVVVRPKQMSPEQLRDGVRWLAREYYSLARSVRRSRKGFANHKLPSLGGPLLKGPAYLGLNAFQWWQWHYRMVPSLQWLYRRLVSVNKYRFFSDLFRGTNFWASQAPEVGGPAHHSDWAFFSKQGFKRGRQFPLVEATEVRAPRA
ncbi:MAG: cobalamin B12-binding domain-containing protein [Myxococcus sp.]|nr:cobalamin B12-binding domain-containing protein [Myxococcus sp.]